MNSVIEFLRKTVRPGLAWAFGLAIITGFFLQAISAETFIGIAGPVIGFYFNSREKQGE